jgi:hypothetical protein
MNKYTILKWEQLLLWLIPPILRKRAHFAWLNVLLTPIHTIYKETLYKMQHTGQVIYLEKVLNETFNPTKKYNPNLSMEQKRLRGLIYIDESNKPTIQYVYLHKEYFDPDPDPKLETPLLKLLRIPMLKVFNHEEYENKDNKPVYLAHRKDYTKVAYANFRVFIPEFLITTESKTKDLKTIITMKSRNDSVQKTEPITVATMEYHNLLYFYKLAGKSYESYSYNIPEEKG